MISQSDVVDKTYQQGVTLFSLRRYPESENMLRQVLARDPRHGLAHAYLALSLLSQSTASAPQPGKLRDGLEEARRAVAAKPDDDFPFFALAWASLANRSQVDALRAAQDGMRIDPHAAWGYLVHAQVYLERREWDKALRSAEYGLKIDPEETGLLNQRAYALIMLGQTDGARQAVEIALAHDPASDVAHSNRGWLALYSGDQQAALGHFREALRLDPQSEAARQGFLQALQARNLLYRGMVRYSLWMSRLTRSEGLAFLVGLSSVDVVLRELAAAFFPLYLLYIPFTFLYSGFVFFSWISDALFYLLLRFSRSGRLLLKKDEVAASNAFGACLLATLLNISAGLVWWNWGFLAGAVLALLLLVPVSGIFKVNPEKRGRRAVLVVLVSWLVMTAACGQATVFLQTPWLILPLLLFGIGLIIYPWIANLMLLME
jgi:tetratricopeptide (TPR) repeat protein